MTFERYAVFSCPPEGALSDFAASWLGWDSRRGAMRAHPAVGDLPVAIETLTERPRKYGFHGTIKPPFRLAGGVDRAALEAAFETLCQQLRPVTLDGLEVARLGSFFALLPQGDAAPLGDMAAHVVRALDRFRAPLLEAELQRRREARLSTRQEENLGRWGYPYVMEEFRFHMTLTGRVAKADRDAVQAVVRRAFDPVLPRPYEIGALCLLGETQDGRFHIVREVALGDG